MQVFSNQRVVVMGLGRFGGGVGVARYLHRRGAHVLVTDSAPPETLRDSVQQLEGLPNIAFRLGAHAHNDFTSADLIVANPAVQPEHNEYLDAARGAGIPITSEIRLLVNQLPNRKRVIGVTGSAGKSTVTAMVGGVLRGWAGEPGRGRHEGTTTRRGARPAGAEGEDGLFSGNTEGDLSTAGADSSPQVRASVPSCLWPPPQIWVGGNLGGSLLNDLERISPNDFVVLELSSFMLHGLAEDRWSPGIAVVTNLSPNHLDWHGSYARYVEAKGRILQFQEADDLAVLGPGVGEAITPGPATMFHVKHVCSDLGELGVPGQHNRMNATLARQVTDHLGVGRAHSVPALQGFVGLAHRLELVAAHKGVGYFNDSKSTTPAAAQRALEVFTPGRIHAILGGYDKQSDLAGLCHAAALHCRAVYTIGQTGPTIAAQLDAYREQANLRTQVTRCGDLERAVAAATDRVRPGDVVLLSPGCASWDQFDHFAQRGEGFTQAVRAHVGQADPVQS